MLLTQILLLFIHGVTAHPFHVSVCDVVYNESAHSLEITHKFFLDDLEEALSLYSDHNLDLLSDPDPGKINPYLKSYMEENFSLSWNGMPLKLDYLGSEINEGAVRCYLEVQGIGKLSEATVMDKALFETFDDQQNLIHFRVGGEVRSYLIAKNSPSANVNFKN